ncbi:hypothetical protein HDU79_003729 [Rhizoclosmatium sp. JEL0117]|nr:hypothetical protein HDU79_003729 [Rhizoclosmatium sp. JEL0117]
MTAEAAARVVGLVCALSSATTKVANQTAAVAWLASLFAADKGRDSPTPRLSPNALCEWLAALTLQVSLIGACAPLVDAILKMDRWFVVLTDTRIVREYSHLVENLVSAHASLVQPVVASLVSALRNARTGKESPAALSTKFDRIHSVLNAVIRLIPSGPSFMQSILSENFPHKSEDVLDNLWYLKNLFRIVEYAPVLRNSVWALAIDRVAQVDVEIQSALDDLSEEDYNQVLAHCFDIDASGHDRESITFMSPKTFASAGRVGAAMPDELRLDEEDDEPSQNTPRGPTAPDDDDSDQESESEDDSDEEEDDAAPPPVVSDFRISSGKLDSLLHFLLTQLTHIYSPTTPIGPGSSNRRNVSTANYGETSDEVFEFFTILLQIFERTVLPTHQCKYVQFLYFHACSMSARCTEAFLVLLAQKTFDTSSPAIIRCAASAYLSSFVARAKFVEIEAVLYCLKMMNGWALNYVEANEPNVKVGAVLDGGKAHACFYSVIQALLYVFCFRWKEIVNAAGVVSGGEEGRNVEYGRLPAEMNGFQKLVQSRFQPLKVCTKSVVAEFARITHKLDMLYCYTHIQKPVVTAQQTQAGLLPPRPPQSQPMRAVRINNNHTNQSQTNYASFTSSFYSPEVPGSISPDASMNMSYVQESTLNQRMGNTPQQQYPTQAQPQDTLGSACLEAFFPFDPCHLVMSKKVVEPMYNEWIEDEDTAGGGGDSDIDYISSSFENQMSMSC